MAGSIGTAVRVHVCAHRHRTNGTHPTVRVHGIGIAELDDVLSGKKSAPASVDSDAPALECCAVLVVLGLLDPVGVDDLEPNNLAARSVGDQMPERSATQIHVHLREFNEVTPRLRRVWTQQHVRDLRFIQWLPFTS